MDDKKINSKDFKLTSSYPRWFNDGQSKALDRLVEFKRDSKAHKFVIEGPGGTGKTTIIKEYRKQCGNKGGFIVAAPTHKAVKVISKSAGIEGHTIQKLLGFRPNYNIDNFDPNNIQFDPFGKRHIENYTDIVIDEASMLTAKMIKYLDSEAIKHKVKLVYTGDSYQLPPVKEYYSSFANVPLASKATLTQIMRQGDNNPLSKLLDEIRWGINKKNFNYINDIMGKHSIVNGKGFMHVDIDTFQKYVNRAFNNDAFFKNIDFCKMITYTNANVTIWNKYIRDCIFPENHDKLITINDLFTCYNTILDEFNDTKIVNSEDYIVKDLTDYKNSDGLSGWMVKLIEVSTGKHTPYMFILNHKDETTLKHYTLTLLRLANEASNRNIPSYIRSKKWQLFYEYKNRNLCLIAIKNPDDPKRNLADKDLDYGYAITSHKSQGSTYSHSFVNLNNIIYGDGDTGNMLNNANMINRLFYVAASRASDTLTTLF